MSHVVLPPRPRYLSFTAALFWILAAANPMAVAQDAAAPAASESAEKAATEIAGVTFSDPITANWQVGFQAVAAKKSAINLFVTLPVPRDWPEQTVAVVNETIPPDVGKIKYRELNGDIKQLTAIVPRLRPGDEVRMLMTFQVKTSQINPPPDTTIFKRAKTSHKVGKRFLSASPQISFRDSKLRKQVKELVTDKATAWEEVAAIYDWVRDNIDVRTGDARDTVKVFRERFGSGEDLAGLFVGMCRANKVPARIVWVTGKTYAEFMLIDENKQAHWFPCVLVGPHEFGSLSEPRIILQKGDAIRVPEKKRRQKYLAEFATCQGTAKPVVRFVRKLVPVE